MLFCLLAQELHGLLIARGFDKKGSGYFGNLFHRLYDSSPNRAVFLALEPGLKLKNPRWDSHGLENVLRRWAKEDLKATFRWLDEMESPASNKLALTALSSAWSENDRVDCLKSLWDRLNTKQQVHLLDQLRYGGNIEAFYRGWMRM